MSLSVAWQTARTAFFFPNSLFFFLSDMTANLERIVPLCLMIDLRIAR